MRNVHTRHIAAPAAAVEGVLATLSSEHDRAWPSPRWWPLRFDGPLAPGAKGGHGPVRYSVEEVASDRVRFRFDPRIGLPGHHEFTVAAEDGGCRVTHVLEGRATGAMRLLWPLAVRWCHDGLIEDAFDTIERSATGEVRRPHREPVWTRMWRRIFFDRPRRLGRIPEGARLAAEAFPQPPDYWDSFSIPLRPGMPRDPGEWASAIFFHQPFPTYASASDEALIGDVKPCDFRVSVLVEERRLVMSTVVRLRSRPERAYFAAIVVFHRIFVKFMLRRAVRRASEAGRGTLVG